MRPPGLNLTETAVWEWLTEEHGYDEDEITRAGKNPTPDFITPDDAYDARRPYSEMKLLVGSRQRKKLDEHDPLIVVMHEADDEPRDVFRWSERDDAMYAIGESTSPSSITVHLDDSTKASLDRMIADIDPSFDYGDLIEYVTQVYSTHQSAFVDYYR